MKNIVVVNGSPEKMGDINKKLNNLSENIMAAGDRYFQIELRDLDIHHCTGCWSCWNKTPGLCIFDDDMPDCYRKIVHADVLIMASPVIMGYPSAILKRFMDRMIPLVHPYIEWENGECHHMARYDHYPRMALYLEKGTDTDNDDINIIRDLFSRAARNLKTDLAFTYTTSDRLEDVCNEINNL